MYTTSLRSPNKGDCRRPALCLTNVLVMKIKPCEAIAGCINLVEMIFTHTGRGCHVIDGNSSCYTRMGVKLCSRSEASRHLGKI